MKNLSLIGASGSIGKQTIDVVLNNKGDLKLVAFSVGKNIEYANEILNLIDTVELVCVQNKKDIAKIAHPNVVYGDEGLIDVATFDSAHVVLTAIVGSVGLVPTEAAIKAKKDIALANKETLVTAGSYIMQLAKENNVNIYPVDSEHSAIFQCLNGEKHDEINKLIITASGGSFRDLSIEQLQNVTVKDALNHPNWDMGAKITIDSATMMNKALEVIEARYLFDVDFDDIEVVIHDESIIHSMVEFVDYSVIAQLGMPDMRLPIQYALLYPKRKEIKNSQRLDLVKIGKLHFKDVDPNKYPLFYLAISAAKKGGTYPTVLNAANEIAVEMFLNGRIKFLQIADVVKEALELHESIENATISQVKELDKQIKSEVRGRY